jgi:hypothetical protein
LRVNSLRSLREKISRKERKSERKIKILN